MQNRAELQYCYELAFYPPRLNGVWRQLKSGEVSDVEVLGKRLDVALLLHQALPSEGYSSQRALTRLALYQAKARAFGTVRFLENLRRRLNRGPLEETVVPGWMVRDIGLPPFCHHDSASSGQPFRA